MDNFTKGFSSLNTEIVINQLPIQGAIPAWLSGTLLRNGPAQFEIGGKSFRHWFDGLAMLHRFSFSNGQVSYANKFLKSKAYTAAKESGAIAYSEFATDPCRSGFRRVQTIFQPQLTDNANVNMGKIADRFVAMTETPLPIIFDPDTLETLGVVQYRDNLFGQLTTAHPHYDRNRQEMINYLTHFSARSSYQIYRMAFGAESRHLIAHIPVREPSYMHSFALTEHYIVLTAYPFTVNPLRLLLADKPFIENFRWRPERGTIFYVVERKTGTIAATITTEAFFAFHHINAFEEEDHIVMDIAAYPDAEIIQQLYLKRVISGSFCSPVFKRYHIWLRDKMITHDAMTDIAIELPRINSCFERMPYRFAYGTSSDPAQSGFLDQLVKVDIEQRGTKTWHESLCYPGEPVFVGAPNGAHEDYGVILSVVLNAHKNNSFLLILDARSFTKIARAEVPHHIPFGFHGQYVV